MLKDEFWNLMGDAINSVFRSGDSCDLGSCKCWYDVAEPDVLEYEVGYEQLDKLVREQGYVDTWCSENVPGIIPDGTDKETAIHLIYDWILNFAEYDETILYTDRQKTSQSAYSIITTGRGICSSYSKLFRSMIEIIPFNGENGLVDWQNGTDHITVAIIDYCPLDSNGHEWAAIQSTDGTWLHYDLSSADRFDARDVYYAKTTENVAEIWRGCFANPDQWVWYH